MNYAGVWGIDYPKAQLSLLIPLRALADGAQCNLPVIRILLRLPQTGKAIHLPGINMTLAPLFMVCLQAFSYKAATALHIGSDDTSQSATQGCQQVDGKVWW